MWFNRAALKAEAKACMKVSKTSPYITALIYVLATFLISWLANRALPAAPLEVYVTDEYTIGVRYTADIFYYVGSRPLGYLVNLLLQVAALMLDTGMVLFTLKVARREENSVWNLVDGFAQFWRVILLYLAEGLFIFLWSLLFVIPGIVAAYRYRLAVYLLLDHPGMGVMDCIRESKRLMSGRKGELFVLDLSFFLWLLLTWLPYIGIAAEVFVAPYIMTTRAGFYLAALSLDAGGGRDGDPGAGREREDGGDYREPCE